MNDVLKRKPNESIKKYQVRLSLGLLNREIGYEDLEWEDVKELLNSTEHRDTLRRKAKGIALYDDVIKEEGFDNVSQETIKEIDEKILEMKKEKRKLADQRSLVNRKINEYARIENMAEIMTEEIRRVYNNTPMISINDCFKTHKTSNSDAVLLLSDVHYGIKIDNYWNQYDVNICRERMSKLISDTIKYSKMHNVDKLHLFLLGDLLSGTIHSSIRLENQENLMKQIINISKILIDSISILANQLPFVIVNLTSGNHERVYAKDENLDGDNYTELIKHNLSVGLENIPNVILTENKYDDIIVSEICGNTIFATHGDKDTINNAIPKLTSMIKVIPDYMFVGHYHNLKEDNYGDCELIINGSLSGMDTYAKDKRLYSTPAQKFMIFDKDGRLCTYNIKFK